MIAMLTGRVFFENKSTAASAIQIYPAFPTRVAAIMMESKNVPCSVWSERRKDISDILKQTSSGGGFRENVPLIDFQTGSALRLSGESE
ncbi:MAG: hypothetical protein KH696_03990 [Sutterella sp.]|uniref:hypothetical protein n=1 Tax=Dakarella massiliensis TaxID=1506471 RepID=UPI003A8DC661|nr:hypothetical protein [Sutterella sp.]